MSTECGAVPLQWRASMSTVKAVSRQIHTQCDEAGIAVPTHSTVAMPSGSRANGALDAIIGCSGRHHATAGVAHLYQRAPLRMLSPHTAPAEPFTGVIANLSGGLVGGDRLDHNLTLLPGTRTLFTSQSAEKIYRSAEHPAHVTTRMAIGSGAIVEWLPQGTIIFDGAAMVRSMAIDLAPDAGLLAGEIAIFGRQAFGERLTRVHLDDDWEIRIDGRLVWADRFRLRPHTMRAMTAPAGLNGARAVATIIVKPPVPDSQLLDRCRKQLEDGAGHGIAGVSRRGPLLVLRLADHDAARLRTRFVAIWAGLRAQVFGHPARLPVIWSI